jgi:hypothetical protein
MIALNFHRCLKIFPRIHVIIVLLALKWKLSDPENLADELIESCRNLPKLFWYACLSEMRSMPYQAGSLVELDHLMLHLAFAFYEEIDIILIYDE